MDAEKYYRSVGLCCPTCGGANFSTDEDQQPAAHFGCVGCGRQLEKSELIEANQENISLHMDEIKRQVVEDFAKELKATLQKAFRGSKHIKIR